MSGVLRDEMRSSSVTPEARQRLSDQIRLQAEKINISRGRSPSVRPSRRWSTIISPDLTSSKTRVGESLPPSVPPSSCPTTGRTPVYTTALLKHSQRLRDRSSSPAMSAPILPDK